MLTKRARRSRGRSILLCCHNYTSPVNVRITKQLQVSTNFVLALLSYPFIPGPAAFVVIISLVFSFFCTSSVLAHFRTPGILYFPSSFNSYVQPISHVHDSTGWSSFHFKVFIRKSIVLRGSCNTAIILRTSTIFRIPLHSLQKKQCVEKKTGPHPSDNESRLSLWLRLTIEPTAPAEVRFDACTEWVARCQLLSAINRIRSLFSLFAQPLSLSLSVSCPPSSSPSCSFHMFRTPALPFLLSH